MLSSLLWCANKWECEYSVEDWAAKMDKMYKKWDNRQDTSSFSCLKSKLKDAFRKRRN